MTICMSLFSGFYFSCMENMKRVDFALLLNGLVFVQLLTCCLWIKGVGAREDSTVGICYMWFSWFSYALRLYALIQQAYEIQLIMCDTMSVPSSDRPFKVGKSKLYIAIWYLTTFPCTNLFAVLGPHLLIFYACARKLSFSIPYGYVCTIMWNGMP